MSLGPLTDAVDAATREALELVPRIWDRDHTVWSDDPTEISDRLGWLDAPERADEVIGELERLAAAVVADGITDVLLVGMGGSSLYPEVLATIFGPAAGSPRLRVLDSTDPAAVLATERALPWQATLLVPASKSGGTVEMACHLARFRERLVDAHGEADAGRWILPITDPGSALDAEAADRGYRASVHGQPDVGGRFSALTPFGLFPAALLGLDLRRHLAAARDELASTRSTEPDENTAAALGAAIATAARSGRDKLTLLLPAELESLGSWIEQLVAESTGKHGVGVLPVLGEPADASLLGQDRLVVAIGEHDGLEDLARAGHPVVTLPWNGPDQLAGEVVRWEFATAVAGALLGINPFDQPDVQAAKTATDQVLRDGDDLPPTDDPTDLLAGVQETDYVALLGFVTPGGEDHDRLEAAASRLRRRLRSAVTVGIGPRYLHSTGQLHKGGPDTGVFLLAVGDDPEDAEVPGRPYSFGRLKRAQAAGDLAALQAAGRRVVHVSPSTLDTL
jgi:transaldolase / glucose-6-phosphate isomerase